MMIYRIRLSFTQKRGVLISVNVETLNILKSEIKEIKKLTNVNSVENGKRQMQSFYKGQDYNDQIKVLPSQQKRICNQYNHLNFLYLHSDHKNNKSILPISIRITPQHFMYCLNVKQLISVISNQYNMNSKQDVSASKPIQLQAIYLQSKTKYGTKKLQREKYSQRKRYKSNNQSLNQAQYTYIQDPSLLPNNQLRFLIKQRETFDHNKKSSMMKKLCQEIEKRGINATTNNLKHPKDKISNHHDSDQCLRSVEKEVQKYEDRDQEQENLKSHKISGLAVRTTREKKSSKLYKATCRKQKNLLKLNALKTIYHPISSMSSRLNNEKSLNSYLNEGHLHVKSKNHSQKAVSLTRNNAGRPDEQIEVPRDHSSLKIQRNSPKNQGRKSLTFSLQRQQIQNRKTNTNISHQKISKDFSKFRLDLSHNPVRQNISAHRYYKKETEQIQTSNKMPDKNSRKSNSSSDSHSQIKSILRSKGSERKNVPQWNDKKNRSVSPDSPQKYIKKGDSRNMERKNKRKFTFIIVQQNQSIITEYLKAKGWYQVIQNSQNFTLKWTCSEQCKSYQILERNNIKNRLSGDSKIMYYNHIKNNMLTKKDLLHQIVLDAKVQGIPMNQFIPQTFTFQERPEFIKYYERNAILILVQKHYQYLQLHKTESESGSEDIQSIVDELCRVYEHSMEFDYEIDRNASASYSIIEYYNRGALIDYQADNKELVNIPMIFHLIVLCCDLWLSQQGGNVDQFDSFFGGICLDSRIMALMIKFSKADLSIHEYHDMKFTNQDSKAKKILEDSFTVHNGRIRLNKTFSAPSSFVKASIRLLYHYMKSSIQERGQIGNNIWIVKPSAGSRGIGIQLIDQAQKINKVLLQNGSKIIQKYIENVWILDDQKISQKKHNSNKIISFLSTHALYNRKFDIRQWVLLVPPKAYIFCEFYLKICSDNYDLFDLNQLSSHLSNYSINKDSYRQKNNPESSVLSEKEFELLLCSLGKEKEFRELKQKITQRITILVESTLENCKWIQGTFELIGFDIIIDENYNPWIIECNMSPACQLRTPWLREIREKSIQQGLDIVMPELKQKICQSQEQQIQPSKSQQISWVELQTKFKNSKISNQEIEHGKIDELCVRGKKLWKNKNK